VTNLKKSFILSAFYISLALLFGLWIWSFMGAQHASDYYTSYFVELSLSLDNLFIISLIFKYFNVPKKLHNQILFWGILGVIVLRGIMITAGMLLVSRFDMVLYVFAVFLILVGIKMLFSTENKQSYMQGVLFKFFEQYLKPHSKYYVLWIIILIDLADIIFAIDSVPAVFAITTNTFIVYTSNIFAVIGLRTLYFALDALLAKFIYLQQALALVLIFIGAKVFLHIPSGIALGVTLLLLTGGMVLSLRKSHGQTSNTR
jgi:tellurite resistance protein TerC